ncbi:unnamed protein product [Heterobilharzia americana]|nr:unnamed protein product [Heterobilharzia americana]
MVESGISSKRNVWIARKLHKHPKNVTFKDSRVKGGRFVEPYPPCSETSRNKANENENSARFTISTLPVDRRRDISFSNIVNQTFVGRVGKIIACGKNVDNFLLVIQLFLWNLHQALGKHIGVLIRVLHCIYLQIYGASKGDTIIQNGATSAVGVYVIQIAKILGFHTVNLFRERETTEATEETRNLLKSYGGTFCLTEPEYIEQEGSQHRFGEKSRPWWYNGYIRWNDTESNDYTSFWLTHFNGRQSIAQRQLTIDQLSKWFSEERIKPSPYLEIPFKDWREALYMSLFNDSTPTGIRKKAILIME